MHIVEADTPHTLQYARELFQEYWNALGFTPCFQDFETELAQLPGDYASPRGRLAVAIVDGEPAGCIALRPIDAMRCEMKRLYVRPQFRNRGLGLALVHWLITEAQSIGYKQLFADTMPVMDRALAMYDWMGFERTEPYSEKPTPGAIYLMLPL